MQGPASDSGPEPAGADSLQRRLRHRALRLLARREYSREELRRKLQTPLPPRRSGRPGARPAGAADASAVGAADSPLARLATDAAADIEGGQAGPRVIPAAVVDAVLDSLEEARWLSDARYADTVVRGKADRMGVAGVARLLAQKGIAGAAAAQALAPLKETERSRAHALWLRKFGTVGADPREKARQYRFLQSRGFDSATISWVLKQAARGVTDPDESD
jgi:regulatory protein